MPPRPDPRQADLFIAYLVDLPLRDQADTMSLPVFSLGKLQRDLASQATPGGHPGRRASWKAPARARPGRMSMSGAPGLLGAARGR